MSRATQEMINCPKCGHAQAFDVWTSLNASLNPDERRKLLDGELTLFRCAGCGQSAPVIHPILYHDTERRFMAWMVPADRETGTSQIPPDMPEEISGLPLTAYTLRHVTSLNRLVEKVLIFDHWLDDRVVEIVKVVVGEQMGGDALPAGSELLFNEVITEVGGAKAMAFTVLSEGGQVQARVPMEPMYRGIAETFGARFPAAEPGEWVRVEREYALAMAVRDEGRETTASPEQAVRVDPEAETPKRRLWRLWK